MLLVRPPRTLSQNHHVGFQDCGFQTGAVCCAARAVLGVGVEVVGEGDASSYVAYFPSRVIGM